MIPERPEYSSPLDALRQYLDALGDQTASEREEGANERRRRVDELYIESAESGAIIDPVTEEFAPQSLADIARQLDAGGEIVFRPALPIKLILPDPPQPWVAVFIELEGEAVLGSISLSPGFSSTVLDLAPPNEGTTVVVVKRAGGIRATSCGDVADDELRIVTLSSDQLLSPTERIELDLATGEINPVTSSDLDDQG